MPTAATVITEATTNVVGKGSLSIGSGDGEDSGEGAGLYPAGVYSSFVS